MVSTCTTFRAFSFDRDVALVRKSVPAGWVAVVMGQRKEGRKEGRQRRME